MAWTSPRTWVALEKVTAALLNTHLRDNLLVFEAFATTDDDGNSRTFTNSSYLDLDALTGGSGTLAACAVTVTTGTSALVTVSAGNLLNSGGVSLLAYRVSGASTISSSDNFGLRNGATTQQGASYQHLVTGLTAGSNTFELQARVTAGTGTLFSPHIHVLALPS